MYTSGMELSSCDTPPCIHRTWINIYILFIKYTNPNSLPLRMHTDYYAFIQTTLRSKAASVKIGYLYLIAVYTGSLKKAVIESRDLCLCH